MTRARTGTVEWRNGCWHARITMPDGRRPWIPMPGIPQTDEPRARLVARTMAARANATGAVPTMRDETVSEYNGRWSDARAATGLSSADEGRRGNDNHLCKRIGHLPMRSVTREHLEDYVAYLDDLVRKAEIRWKTAANLWGFASKMFADATSAKQRDLRILDENPARDVAPPEKGDETLKQYLYPDEFLRTVGSENVPVDRARLYTLAVYTLSRAGELVPLSWDDVDLEHGVIHFHQAIDRVRKPDVVKGTKGKRGRRVPIEATLRPMLLDMKRASRSSRVLPDMPRADGEDGLASLLREDMTRAGVTRHELFNATRTRKAMTFHDLRATGTTWSAIRGDDPLKIQQRAGHSSFQTTLGYIREAEILREGFGEVFPPLPVRLFESSGNRPIVSETTGFPEVFVGATGFESVSGGQPTAGNEGESAGEEPPNRPSAADPLGRVAEHLARAVELAAKAGEWEVVATLSRQLESLRLERAGVPPGPRAVLNKEAEKRGSR